MIPLPMAPRARSSKPIRVITLRFMPKFIFLVFLWSLMEVSYDNHTTKLHLFDIESVDESIVSETIDFDKEDMCYNVIICDMANNINLNRLLLYSLR